ncbi:MAG: hypothetical protein DI543_20840 [Bradyrhizobium icense]|jgi:hypothetical protein|nr:MAG: hypothetical protein DI543_20840 [Bradyrhizobium icense]
MATSSGASQVWIEGVAQPLAESQIDCRGWPDVKASANCRFGNRSKRQESRLFGGFMVAPWQRLCRRCNTWLTFEWKPAWSTQPPLFSHTPS